MANKKLSATITIGGAISGTLKSAFGTTESKLKSITTEIGSLTRAQKHLGSAIQVFGRMGKDVDGLRSKYAAATESLTKMRREQERLNGAMRNSERINRITGFHPSAPTVKSVGTGMTVAGGGIIIGLRPTIGAAIDRENAVNAIQNSGVSKNDADAMVKAAAGQKQFGVSTTQATLAVGELRTALGDAHHAIEALPIALKAMSGLQLYDRLHHTDMGSGDSAYQLAKVAEERGGASSPEAMREKYNWAFKALTGSNGKVGVGDLLTSVRSGKGAVQSMSDESFFGDTFLQQSMGADRYGTSSSSLVNAWIGGHQTHSAFTHMLDMGLLDKKHVTLKNGLVSKVDPQALVDAQLFLKDPQTWVDKHLTPLAKKQGVDVNDPSAVMAFVNSIASNPNAANMLLSRIRFSSNIWKDRHNVGLAHDAEASDKANQESSAGKQADAQVRLNDALNDFGTNILPMYTKALGKATDLLKEFNTFAHEHNDLVKVGGLAIAGFGGALVLLGPILTAAGGFLSVYSAIQLRKVVASAEAATGAIATETGAIEAQGAAAAIAGGKLAWFAKRAVAALIIGNLVDAAAHESGLATDKADQAQDDKNWNRFTIAGKMWSGIWRGTEHPGRAVGMTNIADQAQANRVKGETDYLRGQDGLPPVPALAAGRGGAGATVHDNSQVTFQISQLPGQSTDELVDQIVRKMSQRQGVRNRSIMFDPVTP